jgi:hypothetical protein
LRGLCRLLPLPWAKTTIPRGVLRHGQVAGQPDGAGLGPHVLLAARVSGGRGATGTAGTTRAAPAARAIWQAARAVDPVAMPSSTTTAIRPSSDDRRKP